MISLLFSISLFPPFFLLQCQKNENTSEGHREEVEVLKQQLKEREETVQDLKKQLAVAKVNLKDAEIKYATQVQEFFSIHQSVFLTSPLRLVGENRTMLIHLVLNSLTSFFSVLFLLKSPRSIKFTAFVSSSKHYFKSFTIPKWSSPAPHPVSPSQNHPRCKRCSAGKRWVSPLDSGTDDSLRREETVPGRAWIGCPFLWVRIWVLPCLPLLFCDGLCSSWDWSVLPAARPAMACLCSAVGVQGSCLSQNVTALMLHCSFLWKDFFLNTPNCRFGFWTVNWAASYRIKSPEVFWTLNCLVIIYFIILHIYRLNSMFFAFWDLKSHQLLYTY